MLRLVYELKRRSGMGGRRPSGGLRRIRARGAARHRAGVRAPTPAPIVAHEKTHVDVTASDLALRFDAATVN
jgi:hypothetical protein